MWNLRVGLPEKDRNEKVPSRPYGKDLNFDLIKKSIV